MTKNSVRSFCERYDITEDQFYGEAKIGGSLDLGSVTSIPEGFNPTVGGSRQCTLGEIESTLKRTVFS